MVLPGLNIAYVTGTDAQRMLNTGILRESFNHHMPDQTLQICDFGMVLKERRFWQAVGGYLPPPQQLPGNLHPWYYKASLCQFLDTSSYDAIVWLDADMLVMAPIHDEIEDLVGKMKSENLSVGAALDASQLNVGDALSAFARSGSDLAPFEALLDRFNKNRLDGYLNTGFLVITDFGFCKRWQRETLDQDEWLLFEQNTFNALTGANGSRVLEMAAAVWNVHGDLLADVDITNPDSPLRILHTTSAEQRHHIENQIQYPIGNQVLSGWFKLFVRSDLRDLQQQYLLAFLQNNLAHLTRCQLLETPDHA